MKRIKIVLIESVLFLLLFSVCYAQFHSDYDAQNYLRNLGFRSFITNADYIAISSGQIKGMGGITVSLPIFGMVFENNIVILDNCASAAKHSDGTIVLKSNQLYFSGAYGNINGRTLLVIGRNLIHIANRYMQASGK